MPAARTLADGAGADALPAVRWRGAAAVWAPLAPLLWLALWLRLYRLDGQSLWSDEGITAVMAGRSVSEILVNAAGDVHPPLYYLMVRGWAALAGNSEAGLRSLSALLGVLTVAAGYALALRLFGRGAALAAAALLAVSPYLIHYSQEARMYAALACWATLALLFAVRFALDDLPASGAAPFLRRVPPALAGYVLATAATVLTQYFGAVYLIAPTLALSLLRPPLPRNRRWWVWWLAGNAAAALLALPWAMYVAPRFQALVTGGDPLGKTAFVTMAAQVLTFGRGYLALEPSAVRLALVAAGAAALGAAVWLFSALWTPARSTQGAAPARPASAWGSLSDNAARLTLIALAVALPVAALYALTLRRAFYFPEYMKLLLPTFPLAAAILGLGWVGLWSAVAPLPFRRLRRIAATVGTALFAAMMIAPMALGLLAYYGDPRVARDDYRGLYQHIARNYRDGDAVILDAPEQTEIFNYYAQGAWDQYPIPAVRPINDGAARGELEALAGRHRRVWVVLWGWQEADPRRVVETWLNQHAFRTADRWFGNVQLALYNLPQEGPDNTVETRLDAAFGDGIRLRALQLPPMGNPGAPHAQPGASVPVTLVWEAAARPATRYSVFVHLTDANGIPWAQHDGEPGGGTRLTTTWQPGDTVPDRHGLMVPLATPPGQYRLLAGLYDAATGARRVPQGTDAAGDTVTLGMLTVERGNPPPEEALTIRNRMRAALGPLEVIGADREPAGAAGAGGDLKAGGWADIVLHWRTRARPAAAYNVALTLSDGGREVLRQQGLPAAYHPTDAWEPGEIVRDQRRMLLEAPPGAYRLRALLLTPEGRVEASADLGELRVAP